MQQHSKNSNVFCDIVNEWNDNNIWEWLKTYQYTNNTINSINEILKSKSNTITTYELDYNKISNQIDLNFYNALIEIANNNPNKTIIKFININQKNIWELQEKLYKIIWANYPLSEISRIWKNDTILDITFSWIKDTNDNISVTFTDLFTVKLKNKLIWLFISQDEEIEWSKSRIIQNDYKALTFAIKNKIEIKTLDVKQILTEVFNSISDDELNKSIKWSKVEWQHRNIILEKLLKKFDIWIWINNNFTQENISEKENLKENIKKMYKVKIASKHKWDTINSGNAKTYDFKNIQSLSENINEIEKYIIDNYKNHTYKINGISFNTIINNEINPIILKHIRKWKNIWNIELQKMIKVYLNNLNICFDYIAPYIDEYQLDETAKINEWIRNLEIPIKYLFTTYKGTTKKEAMVNIIDWKKWIRWFIDIVDMWIENILDFRRLSKLINNWFINEENIDELLNAWLKITKKILNASNSIIDKYKWAIVSVRWDEILYFIPDIEENKKNDIENEILSIIYNSNLRCRIISNFETKSEWNFEYLEWLTSINKAFEERVEYCIHNYWYQEYDFLYTPNSKLEIEKEIFESSYLYTNDGISITENIINKINLIWFEDIKKAIEMWKNTIVIENIKFDLKREIETWTLLANVSIVND